MWEELCGSDGFKKMVARGGYGDVASRKRLINIAETDHGKSGRFNTRWKRRPRWGTTVIDDDDDADDAD